MKRQSWRAMDLPVDVFEAVFSFLGVQDLCQCQVVCRAWYVVSLPHLWQAIFFGGLPPATMMVHSPGAIAVAQAERRARLAAATGIPISCSPPSLISTSATAITTTTSTTTATTAASANNNNNGNSNTAMNANSTAGTAGFISRSTTNSHSATAAATTAAGIMMAGMATNANNNANNNTATGNNTAAQTPRHSMRLIPIGKIPGSMYRSVRDRIQSVVARIGSGISSHRNDSIFGGNGGGGGAGGGVNGNDLMRRNVTSPIMIGSSTFNSNGNSHHHHHHHHRGQRLFPRIDLLVEHGHYVRTLWMAGDTQLKSLNITEDCLPNVVRLVFNQQVSVGELLDTISRRSPSPTFPSTSASTTAASSESESKSVARRSVPIADRLRSLILRMPERLDNAHLIRLFNLPNLRRLDIRGLGDVTSALTELASRPRGSLPPLKHLSIQLYDPDDIGIAKFISSFPDLVTLDVSFRTDCSSLVILDTGNIAILDDIEAQIATANSALAAADTPSAREAAEARIRALPRILDGSSPLDTMHACSSNRRTIWPKLEDLTISRGHSLWFWWLAGSFPSNATGLEDDDCDNGFSLTLPLTVNELKSPLRRIDLNSRHIEPRLNVLGMLTTFEHPFLVEFAAKNCRGMNDDVLLALVRNAPQLTILILDHCWNLTDSSIHPAIRTLSRLRVINIIGCERVKSLGLSVTDCVNGVGAAASLREVYMKAVTFTDQGVIALFALPYLTILDITGTTTTADVFIQACQTREHLLETGKIVVPGGGGGWLSTLVAGAAAGITDASLLKIMSTFRRLSSMSVLATQVSPPFLAKLARTHPYIMEKPCYD
ncbi:RNI-like protein [Ramicandelaber brevisporus]|nr:RNI-like protein [Ramicandelaber brevisporus]